MPVTPYCNTLFQSHRDLHQFLSICKQASIDKQHSQIVSISLEIDPIDPLVIYQQFAQPEQLNFYIERREIGVKSYSQSQPINLTNGASRVSGMAAIGATIQLRVEGANRFQAAKAFIQQSLANTTVVGSHYRHLTGPHFFCSFTFFDGDSQLNSPFPAATIFLPKWQVSYQDQRCIVVANLTINADTHLESTIEEFKQTLHKIRTTNYQLLPPSVEQRHFLRRQDITDPQHFKQAVASALSTIQDNVLNKIVLAHAVDIFAPLPFHPVHSLLNLRQLYPDCYIFATSNGKGQHFIGASPERLIRLRDRQLMTDALAGSAPRGKTTCEDAHLANTLLNSAKEMHEHQVVIEFITRQLCQLGLTPQSNPLRLLQLSNIQHLQTPIQAKVPTHIHLLDAIAELHPTPAVAGVPRDIACEHIRRYERFERSLYAAPIGWVDHQGNGEFAVGIRSAIIDGCHARLYAGAGIVAGSDPERELAEVQLKLQALLAALV